MDITTTPSGDGSGSGETGKGKGGGGGLERIKGIVEEVCALPAFRDKRAAKMDLDDFLALLAAFNTRGVHFTS